MTGQVKEDLLCRFGELGVRVSEGKLHFDRALLNPEEFLTESVDFDYVDVNQKWQSLSLQAGSLAYTLCQVPVILQRGDSPSIEVNMADGSAQRIQGLTLDQALSRKIFRRTHEVTQLTVTA